MLADYPLVSPGSTIKMCYGPGAGISIGLKSQMIVQGIPESCLAIFIPALVVGNFMVLNLFLALLLNSFNSDELKQRKEVNDQLFA